MSNKLSDIVRDINDGRLHSACAHLRDFIHSNQLTQLYDEIQTVSREYNLLLAYARQGAEDSRRGTLLKGITQHLKRMCTDADIFCERKKNQSYITQGKRLQDYDINASAIRSRLEDYVSMSVLAEVDPTIDSRSLNEEHHSYIAALFIHLTLAKAWTGKERAEYAQLLLSPTIDQNDGAVLISAITLACHAFFDPEKWLMLTDIHLGADDEILKQRAFVGWVINSAGIEDEKECRQRLCQLCEDEDKLQDMILLQKEMLYSCNTINDNKKINDDILPKILKSKGNPLNHLGMNDLDADIDVDAEIEAADEVENYYRQIMKMEHEGSDVFYSGFAHMKRYAFFYNMVNWFTPYRASHPELVKAMGNDEDVMRILSLMDHINLCDSDRYSMALAMPNIYHMMGQDMKELIETGIQQHSIGIPSPTTIRRHYLQDLYRFTHLYPNKHSFDGLLTDIFVINSGFEDTKMNEHFMDIVRTMEKLKMYDKMDKVFEWVARNGILTQATELQLTMARRCLRTKRYQEALMIYIFLHTSGTKTETVVRGLAYCYMMMHQHRDAANHYKYLATTYPEKIRYRMCYLLEMTRAGKATEVLNDIFLLNFEATEGSNDDLLYGSYRLLAWAMLCTGRYEESIRHYNLLKSKGMRSTDDMLHHGMALWLSGDMQEALRQLREWFVEEQNNDDKKDDDNRKEEIIARLYKELEHDATFFSEYNRTDTDITILCELLRMEIDN